MGEFGRVLGVEMVEYQGIRMTREAAEIAEREGIDVWLLKRNLEKTMAERVRANNSGLRLMRALDRAVIRDGRRSVADSAAVS